METRQTAKHAGKLMKTVILFNNNIVLGRSKSGYQISVQNTIINVTKNIKV